MISYQHIRNERQWRASTGLTQKQFELLTSYFEETYLFVNELSINQIDNNLATERILHTYADCLFFVLFQLKNALTYDSLGLLIQTDASNGQRIVEKYLHLLELTLERKHIMPKRNFTTVAEFEAYLKNDTDIILDVSEQPIQRPANGQAQKAAYSGKKNDTLVKNWLSAIRNVIFYILVPFMLVTSMIIRYLKRSFLPTTNGLPSVEYA